MLRSCKMVPTLRNEVAYDEKPLTHLMEKSLDFVQYRKPWMPSSVVCDFKNNQVQRPFTWRYAVRDGDAIYDITATGKLVCVSLYLPHEKPLFQWSAPHQPQLDTIAVQLDSCISPLRLGLCEMTLEISAQEIPSVTATHVLYNDLNVRRAECRPVVQGYKPFAECWDPIQQRLVFFDPSS